MPVVSFCIAPPGGGDGSSLARGATAATLSRPASLAIADLAQRARRGDTLAGAAVTDIAPTDPPVDAGEADAADDPGLLEGFVVRVRVAPPQYDGSAPAMRQLTAATGLVQLAQWVEQVGGAKLARQRIASLHATSGTELNVYAGPAEPLARYTAVRKGRVRSSPELNSEDVGTIRKGEEIIALETSHDSQFGLVRVRFSRGWVSECSATNQQILVRSELLGPETELEPEPEPELLLEAATAPDEPQGVGEWIEEAITADPGPSGSGLRLMFCKRCNAVFLPSPDDKLCPEFHAEAMYSHDVPIELLERDFDSPRPLQDAPDLRAQLSPVAQDGAHEPLLYRVLARAHVQAELEPGSAEVEILDVGTVVEVLEAAMNEDMLVRMRIKSGWVGERDPLGALALARVLPPAASDCGSGVLQGEHSSPVVEIQQPLAEEGGGNDTSKGRRLYRVVREAIVRAGADMDSKKLGELIYDEEVEVRGQARVDSETGIRRLFCLWEDGGSRMGWVSESMANGDPILVLLDQSHGAGTAQSAADGTQPDQAANQASTAEGQNVDAAEAGVGLLQRYDPIFELEAGAQIAGTDWQVFFNEEGVPYYYHCQTQQTTWLEPEAVSRAILAREFHDATSLTGEAEVQGTNVRTTTALLDTGTVEQTEPQLQVPLELHPEPEPQHTPEVECERIDASELPAVGSGKSDALKMAQALARQRDDASILTLYAGLQKQRVGQLRRQTIAAGVDSEQVEGCLDSPDPKDALITLLLRHGGTVIEFDAGGFVATQATLDGSRNSSNSAAVGTAPKRILAPPPRPKLPVQAGWSGQALGTERASELAAATTTTAVAASKTEVERAALAAEREENRASVTLQSQQRGRTVRHQLYAEKRAVTRLQAYQRGRITRTLYRQWNAEFRAAVRIQAVSRGRTTRAYVARYVREYRSTTLLQAHWRGLTIRREMAWWRRQRVRERQRMDRTPTTSRQHYFHSANPGGDRRPPSTHAFAKRWVDLTRNQRQAAERIGFAHDTWDVEYFKRAPAGAAASQQPTLDGCGNNMEQKASGGFGVRLPPGLPNAVVSMAVGLAPPAPVVASDLNTQQTSPTRRPTLRFAHAEAEWRSVGQPHEGLQPQKIKNRWGKHGAGAASGRAWNPLRVDSGARTVVVYARVIAQPNAALVAGLSGGTLAVRSEQLRAGSITACDALTLADLRREIDWVQLVVPRPFAFLRSFMSRDNDVLAPAEESETYLDDLQPSRCVCVVPLAVHGVATGPHADQSPSFEPTRISQPQVHTKSANKEQPELVPLAATARELLAMPAHARELLAAQTATTSSGDSPGEVLPKIRYWKYIFDRNVVQGHVYGLEGSQNGAAITTSKVAYAMGTAFITSSGSRYELLEPEFDFREQMVCSGTYDPQNPLRHFLEMRQAKLQLRELAEGQQSKQRQQQHPAQHHPSRSKGTGASTHPTKTGRSGGRGSPDRRSACSVVDAEGSSSAGYGNQTGERSEAETPGTVICLECKAPLWLYAAGHPQFRKMGKIAEWDCDVCEKKKSDADAMYCCNTLDECDWCACTTCVGWSGRLQARQQQQQQQQQQKKKKKKRSAEQEEEDDNEESERQELAQQQPVVHRRANTESTVEQYQVRSINGSHGISSATEQPQQQHTMETQGSSRHTVEISPPSAQPHRQPPAPQPPSQYVTKKRDCNLGLLQQFQAGVAIDGSSVQNSQSSLPTTLLTTISPAVRDSNLGLLQQFQAGVAIDGSSVQNSQSSLPTTSLTTHSPAVIAMSPTAVLHRQSPEARDHSFEAQAPPKHSYQPGVAGLVQQMNEFRSQGRAAECRMIAERILSRTPAHEIATECFGWSCATLKPQDLSSAVDAANLENREQGRQQQQQQPQQRRQMLPLRLSSSLRLSSPPPPPPPLLPTASSQPQQQQQQQNQGSRLQRARLDNEDRKDACANALRQQAAGMPARSVFQQRDTAWLPTRSHKQKQFSKVAAVVHAARDASAVLIQAHYRGYILRVRLCQPHAVALVERIHSTRHLQHSLLARSASRAPRTKLAVGAAPALRGHAGPLRGRGKIYTWESK